MLKCYHDLTPFADDRAFIWSVSEKDKKSLEKLGLCTIPEVGSVTLEKWNPETQFKDIKVECNNSWIGIEGLRQ